MIGDYFQRNIFLRIVMSEERLKLVPVLVGVGVVAVSAILAKIILDRQKNKKKITLEDPNVKYALKLIEKIELSHDTRLFRFALPSKEHCLGLPIGNFHLHFMTLE